MPAQVQPHITRFFAARISHTVELDVFGLRGRELDIVTVIKVLERGWRFFEAKDGDLFLGIQKLLLYYNLLLFCKRFVVDPFASRYFLLHWFKARQLTINRCVNYMEYYLHNLRFIFTLARITISDVFLCPLLVELFNVVKETCTI